MNNEELLYNLRFMQKEISSILATQREISEVQEKIKAVDDKSKSISSVGRLEILAFVLPTILAMLKYGFAGGAVGLVVSMVLRHYFVTKIEPLRIEKADMYYKENMPPLLKNQKELLELLEQKLNSTETVKIRELLPKEYQNIAAIDFMIRCLSDKTAKSLQDAIDLYNDFLHNTSPL